MKKCSLELLQRELLVGILQCELLVGILQYELLVEILQCELFVENPSRVSCLWEILPVSGLSRGEERIFFLIFNFF